ncbi:hypothetical protein J4D99_19740 [Siccationidurans ginsengisoli]|uniref:hypothetical protein n=1 Tax=Hymenobacter TaxID=89966 RepID=UPI001AADEC89|nr:MULTISPECIES: hypothetical protein [unclassified Hymenobacter]MBO2033636.1 hypothetical protein [Hymenobacter sp. BT559]
MPASFQSFSATTSRPWGRWILLVLGLLLMAALAWLKWGLDPWLRRKLEQQARTQTHGQYTLTVASLRTHLLSRSLHLGGVALRPATPTTADTLPRLTARLASLDLSGVGLLALLRGRTVPIDSLTLDSLRLDVAALARRPAPHPSRPLYQQRPLQLGYLALRHAGGRFGPATKPVGELADGTVSARDVLFTSAGATDTQRLAFAASWRALLRGPVGRLGGHTIKAQAVDFASAQQFLGIDSLHITPPAPGQGKPGAVRVLFTMPHAQLRGLRAAAWQHQGRLRADSLRLSTPHLTFWPPAQAPPPLWKLLAPVFKRADVRRVAIADGYLAVAGVDEAPAVRHLYGVATELRIDSLSQQAAARRVLYARTWVGHTGRLTATLFPPLYPTSIEHAFLNTNQQALRLTELALRPTIGPAQLNQYKGYQSTQLTAHIDEMRAEGFDFQLLSANSHVRIARVTAERPYLLARSDGRGPINHQPSIISPEAMRHLRAHLDVRRLDLRNGTIEASYRSASTPLVGTFGIAQLNATLYNVSNDPSRMSLAHPLTGTATGYLQGQCRAEVHLTTSLLDPQGRQHLRGSFGPAPFSLLNPMLKPTRLISFKSGQAQGIDFEEYVDREHIIGTVRARYSDLRINFLGYKGDEVKKTFFGRIKSGLANVVIRDQNPRPDGRVVTGDIQTPRELEFSTFTAWRQGLIVGFLHNVGIPKKLASKYGEADGGTPLPAPTDAPSRPATTADTPPRTQEPP